MKWVAIRREELVVCFFRKIRTILTNDTKFYVYSTLQSPLGTRLVYLEYDQGLQSLEEKEGEHQSDSLRVVSTYTSGKSTCG